MNEDGKQRNPEKSILKSGDGSANFEQAMLLTGYGRYNFILLLVCGFISISFSCQYDLSAYILPSAKCDLKFSSREMGLINAAFMIGAITSAVISSVIADVFGRRNLLIWLLVIDGCVTLLSSLSQSFHILFICRCINGFAVGGPSVIILLFFGEFHAEKSRTKAVCVLGFSFALSMVLLPSLAWIIIPLKLNIVVYGYAFNSWRLLLGIFGFPSLLGAFLLSNFPETPKFLFSQGQNANALKVMQQMYASNTKQEVYNYPVETLIPEYSTTYNESNTFSGTMKKMWEQIRCLFSPPLGKYTILVACLLFTNVFGYAGLSLWLPELFNRLETYYKSHPDAAITICELAHIRKENYYESVDADVLKISNETYNFTMDIHSIFSNTTTGQLLADNSTITICDSFVDPKVFVKTMMIGFSSLLSNLAVSYLANRWDRRVMPIATMLISGISGLAIYFSHTSMQNTIVTCIFLSSMSVANLMLYCEIIDLFPTNVKAMATGVSSLCGRFGGILSNILFGWLLDDHCEVPILLVGSVVLFGGLLGFFLPKHPLVLPHADKFESEYSLPEKNLLKNNENEHFYCTAR